MDPIIAKHIESTPGVCGGRPWIAGTRIRAQDIVTWHERLRYSPDEIVSHYPQLTLAGVKEVVGGGIVFGNIEPDIIEILARLLREAIAAHKVG